MLVQKEAITIPIEAKRPPTSMTGRQPKRLTHTLQSGPRQEKQITVAKINQLIYDFMTLLQLIFMTFCVSLVAFKV